jgi:hypothetical protein
VDHRGTIPVVEALLFWLIAGGLVSSVTAYLGGRGLLSRAVASSRARRALRRLPRRGLADVQDGPAAVEGRVAALDTLEAPLSGERVVAYRIRVEQLADIEYGYQRSEVLLDVADVCDFVVADGTDRAVIRAGGSDVLLLLGDPDEVHGEQTPRVKLQDLLARRSLALTREPLWDGNVVLTEYRLRPESTACVIGRARRVLDGSAETHNYRRVPTRLTIEQPRRVPLFVSNQSRDATAGSLGKGPDLRLVRGRRG